MLLSALASDVGESAGVQVRVGSVGSSVMEHCSIRTGVVPNLPASLLIALWVRCLSVSGSTVDPWRGFVV